MPHTSRASRLRTCDRRWTTTRADPSPGCERISSASAWAIVSSTRAISRWKMRERRRGGASQRASPETWQKMWREWSEAEEEEGEEEEEEEPLLLPSPPSALSTPTASPPFPLSSSSRRHSASTSSRIILTYHPSSCAELYSEPIDRARAPVTSWGVRV